MKKEALRKHEREDTLKAREAEDITPFLDQVRALVHDAGLVLVSTTPVG